VLEHLVEGLGQLHLGSLVAGDGGRHRLVHLGQPPVGGDRLGDARARRPLEVGPVREDVVQQAPGLVLLDLEPGELAQLAGVVAELDDAGVDPQPVAAGGRDELQLLDVEAHVVQALEPAVDEVALAGTELVLPGQLVPQPPVAPLQLLERLAGSTSDGRYDASARSMISPATFSVAIVRSWMRWPSDSCSRSSPVSASTR
jgi:hypothetical protein